MLWHFSAPLMCPAIKIFLKWLGIYSLPVCTKCRHSKPAQPASAAQCWYERLNFLSLYTFSYCSKIYLLAEPGNFWSDEKSCFVAFYVAGWKKYCVYWMLKNNAIPKYLDYTISQSRLILLFGRFFLMFLANNPKCYPMLTEFVDWIINTGCFNKQEVN